VQIPLLKLTKTLEVLKTLYFDNRRQERITPHHEHTFDWLWNHPEYCSWESSSSSNMLFVEGKPGSGKSTLTRYFSEKLSQQWAVRYDDPPIIAKFCYSHRDGELEMIHYNMLRCLLYDILEADESFFVHFQKEFRKLKQRSADNTLWDYQTLKRILLACRSHRLKKRLYLIIDAMDESNQGDRLDTVILLRNISVSGLINNDTSCVVKVFLTSRPIVELPKDFKLNCNNILLQDNNREGIAKYSNDFLENPDFDILPDIKTRVKEYIIKHAEGVFLWVKLIYQELIVYINKGRNKNQIMGFLKSLPMELEGYYEHMLRMCAGDEITIKNGRRVLLFCLFSHRPIEVVELQHALAVDDFRDTLEDGMSTDILKLLTDCARNFIDTKTTARTHRRARGVYDNSAIYCNRMLKTLLETNADTVVQVMHQTVRDFFLRPHPAVEQSGYCTSSEEAYRIIGTTCINYLRLLYDELNRKVSRATDNWSLKEITECIVHLEKRPFALYSLEYLDMLQNDNAYPNVSHLLSDFVAAKTDSPLQPAFFVLERLTGPERHCQEQRDMFLRVAARKGFIWACRVLIGSGADLTAADSAGLGPLHHSAVNGHRTVSEFLIETGANVNAVDKAGLNALQHAVINGHWTLMELLDPNDAHDTSHFEFYDIQHVRNKFPEAAEYLVDRCGKANTTRRKALRILQKDSKKFEPIATRARKQTEVSNFVKRGQGAIDTHSEIDQSQTSFVSSVYGFKVSPKVPALDGLPFLCPFCFSITRVTSQKLWV